jgi:hypothetical protein
MWKLYNMLSLTNGSIKKLKRKLKTFLKQIKRKAHLPKPVDIAVLRESYSNTEKNNFK